MKFLLKKCCVVGEPVMRVVSVATVLFSFAAIASSWSACKKVGERE